MFVLVWVKPLRHVRQRSTNDCALAAIAIVAQIPYEAAVERSCTKLGKRGLRLRGICSALKRVTGVEWRVGAFGWFRKVSRFTATDEALVLVIREPKLWVANYHCIVVHSNRVYDPAHPISYPVDSYPHKAWQVMHVFQKACVSRRDWLLDRLKLIGCGLAVFFSAWIVAILLAWGTGSF